jgi:hypothetical protein
MSPTQLKNLTFAKALEIVEAEARPAAVLKQHGVTMLDVAKALGRVLLTQKRNEEKRSEERTKVMSEPMGVVSVAKRGAQALEGGEISQETFAKLQQRCAQEMFPTDSMGVALSKFFATPVGAEMLSRGLKKSYEDGQRRTAANAAEVVMKMTRPHAEHAAPRDTSNDPKPIRAAPRNTSPTTEFDEESGTRMESDDPDGELEKLGEAYRAAHPEAKFSQAQAVAHVMAHDEDGRALLQQSKEKYLRKYMR